MDLGEARDVAWMFLHRDGRRWAHVEGVAARAEELRPAVPAEEGDLLVAAAWLHDIGYSPVLTETGFHPYDGAVYLESTGHRRLAELVAHHSGSRFVADHLGLGPQLARYPFTEDALTDALTYADQTVGADGERQTVQERLADTARRHGPDAPRTRVRHLREPYALAAGARAERRLRAAEAGPPRARRPEA
jgi:HD domain